MAWHGTHAFGDFFPLELDRSTTAATFSVELGEPLLRTRFCAGSARSALGGADAALAMDVNCRGDET